MKLYHDDTITAIATGPGEYGIGIIRLSGPAVQTVLDCHLERSAGGDWLPRRLYHGYFVAADREHLDEVMAVVFPGPHSFSGEMCAEIHCHGGRVVMRRILDELISAGLRLAQPGEFTRRAFLNGRLDLSQAEAIADLIHARSDNARRTAMAQLEGGIFRLVHGLRDQVADLLALVEAYIDFPEEEIGSLDARRLRDTATTLHTAFSRLIAGYEQGRIVRDGAAVLILGRPNVGKSSLLNLLVGEQRALVSDIPGTTRDTIEESIILAGLPFRIIDSAGIREQPDTIEAEGIRRALAKLAAADLVLLVFDGSQGFTAADAAILAQCGTTPVILVQNKIDLPQTDNLALPPELPVLPLSCRMHQGLEQLPLMLEKCLLGEAAVVPGTDTLITDLRHKEALVRSRASLATFERLLHDDAPLELAACELRDILDALGEITGETTPDAILDRIFSRFCIGK